MDKLLLAFGVLLIYGAYTGKHREYADTGIALLEDKSFKGTMLVLLTLFIIAQYIPKYSYIPASIALLVALNAGLKRG